MDRFMASTPSPKTGTELAKSRVPSPVEEHHGSTHLKSVRPQVELGVLLEERLPAAARHLTFPLPLGTLAEVAEPAEIPIRPRLQQKDIHLVMRDADTLLGQQLIQRTAAGFPQRP
jgi:hypothetical protein